MGPGSTGETPGGSGVDPDTGGTDDGRPSTTDGGSVDECPWEPARDLACDPDDGATALVGGDPLPALTDESCTIGPITALPPAVTFELSCPSDDYLIHVEATGFTPPFSDGDPVSVTSGLGFPLVDGQDSLAIRDADGELLLGWINHDLEDEDLFAEVVGPIQMDVQSSGCPGEVDEACDGVRQRARVGFEAGDAPLALFGGQTGLLGEAQSYGITVDEAQWYPCWDSCGGDWSPGRFVVLVWLVG